MVLFTFFINVFFPSILNWKLLSLDTLMRVQIFLFVYLIACHSIYNETKVNTKYIIVV